MLETLHRRQPGNQKVTDDLIVVYCWNAQYAEAASLFEQRNADNYPVYVQKAIMKAYRNMGKPNLSLAIVNRLLKIRPQSSDLLFFKGMLFVDERQLGSARAILAQLLSETGRDSRYYRLSGYLQTAEENWIAALADYQHLSRLLPDDREAVHERFAALQNVRAQEAAGNVLAGHQQSFSAYDRAQHFLNQAAEKLRWATDASRDFNETRRLAKQALALQIKALDLVGMKSAPGNWPVPVFNDLLVTLRVLRQTDKVQVLYRQLIKQEEVPDYAKQAVAGAMLADHQPDKACELYQQVLKKEPGNYQAQIGLFYSFVEKEDFDSAYRLIDNLKEHEPLFQITKEQKNHFYNERLLDLNVYAILARYYGDQLETAWSRIDELVRNAPANNWLLEVRGQIENAREWYRRAYGDFHYASLLSPDSLDARTGEASSLIDLKRYRQARPLLQSMRQKFPDEYSTRKVEKKWRFSRKPEYWADITYSNSSGPELNGDGVLASAEVLSAPINDNFYLDAFYRYAWNEIIEGEETFQRYSLGLNYQLLEWQLLGRITYNDSDLDEIGGSATAIWTPDDFWRFSFGGERFSVDTPLRALFHGIRADAVFASLNYRWSEQRDLSFGIRGAFFTDDNNRIEGTAVLRQRLIDVPHIDLDGRVEAYASANSRRDAPYFNPEHDLSLLGALHLDHVYFRHYDHLLSQQIDAGYGFYDQSAFVPRWIGHIRYEQRYRLDPWMEVLAGVEFGQNVYDGHAEPYRLVRFMINGKF